MDIHQPLNHCVEMKLPDDQVKEAARLAILENPDNAPTADIVPGESIDNLEMALIVQKKWRNGRILRVRFLDGDLGIQEKVRKYSDEWSRYANIGFAYGNDPDAEVRVTFQNRGFWSYVGTDNLNIPKGEPTMSLTGLTGTSPESEISRVVLHEFGHCIGVSHEQSNPTANIPWDREAVYRYYADPSHGGWTREMVDRNVLTKFDPQGVAFTPHDTKSIMQYPVPNELTIGDFEIGWNTNLSEIDKQFISQMYPFGVRDNRNISIEGPVIIPAALPNDIHYQ